MSKTKRPMNECLDCHRTWYPRGQNLSDLCPRCKGQNVQIASRPSSTWINVFHISLRNHTLQNTRPLPQVQNTRPSPHPTSEQGGLWMLGFLGLFILVALTYSFSNRKKPQNIIEKASLSVSSHHSPSLIHPLKRGASVKLAKNCKVWAFKKDGKTYLLKRGKRGESSSFLRNYKKSTKLRFPDGREGWVAQSCIMAR